MRLSKKPVRSTFQVCATRCDECLFSRRKVVSAARRRQILAQCERQDTHFVCHKHSLRADGAQGAAKQQANDVCCRAFYDRNPRATLLMRLAVHLGLVEFVDESGHAVGEQEKP